MGRARLIPSFKISCNIVSRVVLILSIILGISVFFIYRPLSWPYGMEAIGCWVCVMLISTLTIMLWIFRKKVITDIQTRNVWAGLCLGLLWTIEISVNNFIRPGLPLRDIVDNLFWGFIGLFILIIAAYDAYTSDKFIDGIKSGFWNGLASGAIACLSALLIIVFGMKFIMLDPLNIKEWADVKTTVYSPRMDVYFAYQAFAGAIMHLFILGVLMGLILGSFGGISGKILRILAK